ncbi:hypothetical protein Tco_0262360 [Tanacetum coccineum]
MRTIQKVHCGFIVIVNDLKTQGVIFKVFNTRRQQTEETYHITFDESPDAIKFSKPSVDNINIAENERYPPNEYLHPYEPSQRNYGVICEDMLKGAYFGAKRMIFED